MEKIPLLCISLVAFGGLTKGAGVLPDGPLSAAVGESVMFTTTFTPTNEPLFSVSWKFGDKDIITLTNVNKTAPEYEGRITLFIYTGSLELRNVALNDSGEYTVTITPHGETQEGGNIRLNVYGKISGANITSSTNLPTEGNSVNLTCDAAGPVVSREWMKDGSDMNLNDNMILYDNDSVLAFSSLKISDSGEYSCNISSSINYVEVKYTMVVNYGPDNVRITGPNEIPLGQMLKLTCSADSTPSAGFTWKLNGTEIHNSDVFTKENTELSDSGNYICEAMNDITGRTSSSAVHTLSVTDTDSENPSGCSSGCIVGIVVACLVVLTAAAVAGYFIYKKR